LRSILKVEDCRRRRGAKTTFNRKIDYRCLTAKCVRNKAGDVSPVTQAFCRPPFRAE
jgi:hypothetical protein